MAQQPAGTIDVREALFNDKPIGPASTIQVPREGVASLSGFVIDIDPGFITPNPWFKPADDPEEFFNGIEPVLHRHAILRHAEVRSTGRGLHALVRFCPTVELHTASDQKRWAQMHSVLRATIPSDPSASVLIGLTRPVGSINSKTGTKVKTLKTGTAISGDELIAWLTSLSHKPFETVGMLLYGQRRVHPCPYCCQPDSYLDLGERTGWCYGPCRRIPLAEIMKPFFSTATHADDTVALTAPQKSVKKAKSTKRKKQ